MSRVRMQSFGGMGGGGVPIRSSWTDDFSGGNASIHVNYLWLGSSLNTISAATGAWVVTGGGGTSNMAVAIPWKAPGINNRSQFCRATYVSDNGAVGDPTRPILCVLATGDGMTGTLNCYHWTIRREVADSQLGKSTGGGFAVAGATLVAGLPLPALGSVLEIQARIVSATQVDITLLDDGAVVTTFSDNPNPYITGMPGIGSRNSITAVRSFSFDNLACGLL